MWWVHRVTAAVGQGRQSVRGVPASVLDETGQWVARINYLVRGSEVIPVGTEVALRPPCPGHPGWVTAETGFGPRRHHVDDDGVLHTDDEVDYRPPDRSCDCPWPTEADTAAAHADVRTPGLTLTHLRKISINSDLVRTRDALHTVLDLQDALGADDPVIQAATDALADDDGRPRVGRPRRPRLPLLRALRLYEQGEQIADIAAEIGYSRSWVKDALVWSRREGLLIGGSGRRGARGGHMSDAAKNELAQREQRHYAEAQNGQH